MPETSRHGSRRAETQAEYLGEPSDARCKLAFFEFGNVDVELLEPDRKASCWRDILERKGPGFHHFAFKIRGMKDKIKRVREGRTTRFCSGASSPAAATPIWTRSSSYGALIELLEFDGN